MFSAVQAMSTISIWCGLIWALVLGFSSGNYACSLIHRLPRGKLILDKKPYCGTCAAPLQVRDLFPVISALLLRHRCRYCGTPYPFSHTVTEVLVGVLFVLGFLQYGFGEQFILFTLLGVFLITLAAIEVNDGIIMGRILLVIMVGGMLLRTLADASIYGFIGGALVGGVLGAMIWHKTITRAGHIYVLPIQAQLFAVGGLCVGVNGLPVFLLAFSAVYAALRIIKKPLLALPFVVAVLIPILVTYQ